jgi:integrase
VLRQGTVRPATVATHYRSLQQLFRWLVDDGEIERSPMERMRPPAVPEQPVPIVTDAHLEALLATCKGNTFENRRDLAIIRLFLDTGLGAGELAGLQIDDLDQEEASAYVLGKGGRHRACPYGGRTADALRRVSQGRVASGWPAEPVRSPPPSGSGHSSADRLVSRWVSRPRGLCVGALGLEGPVAEVGGHGPVGGATGALPRSATAVTPGPPPC